jgi:hypothetical protein
MPQVVMHCNYVALYIVSHIILYYIILYYIILYYIILYCVSYIMSHYIMLHSLYFGFYGGNYLIELAYVMSLTYFVRTHKQRCRNCQ